MIIAEVLSALAGVPANNIKKLVAAGVSVAPWDSAEEGRRLLLTLDRAITPEAIASLWGVVSAELREILAGQINPADNPSDSA